MSNTEYINDARALLDTADLCVTPPAQARNLYIQAARILRACPKSSDWRESVRISNLISYADECANLA